MEDIIQALITERILAYHKRLCEDYGLERLPGERYGVAVNHCTELNSGLKDPSLPLGEPL